MKKILIICCMVLMLSTSLNAKEDNKDTDIERISLSEALLLKDCLLSANCKDANMLLKAGNLMIYIRGFNDACALNYTLQTKLNKTDINDYIYNCLNKSPLFTLNDIFQDVNLGKYSSNEMLVTALLTSSLKCYNIK